MRRYELAVTTAADGTATAYFPRVRGFVEQIQYVKPGSGNFDDGVDFAITGETTGQGIWTEANVNASATKAPRLPTHTLVGVAATLDGTVAALAKIALSAERVKVVIAQGGNAKSGTFYLTVSND